MSKYGFEIGIGMFTGTAFEALAITTATASLFTAAVYGTKPMRALLTVEDGSCRYRYDGGVPTATVGHMINSGDIVAILGQSNIQSFQVLVISGSASLMVSYETDKR